jgi:DNA-binding IclR family transcriptional regulator
MSTESRIVRRAGATRAEAAQRGSGRSGIQSVEVAGAILCALAASGGVLALRELAVACDMGRAKVHRYLVSLKRAGFVVQDPRSRQYRIGPAAVTVGLVGLGSQSALRHVTEGLPALRDRVEQTVTAAIWGDMGPTIIAMEEAGGAVTMNVRVGSVLPLFGSAIGQVFAAFLPAAAVRERFVHGEVAAATQPPPDEVKRLIAGVRRQRMARVRGALMPGIDALAAPVFDYRGKTVAVVCVLGRSEELDTGWDGRAAQGLAESTEAMSRALGFVALTPPR